MRTFTVAFVDGIVCVIFASGIAIAWTGPTGSPPNNNVSAPVNVGSTDQVKNASLGVNGLAIFGNGLLSGSSRYLNWGTTAGDTGYGLRDNAGTMEFKNNNGSWTAMGGGGGLTWLASGNNIYNTNSGNVGIGTASPGQALELYRDNADAGIRFNASNSYLYSMGIDWSDSTKKFKINYGGGIGDNAHLSMDTSGNVTLGSSLLVQGTTISYVKGSASFQIRDRPSAGVELYSQNAYVNLKSSSSIYFRTGSGENVMVMYHDGNVGIGTAGPGQKLHVVGNVLANSYITPSDARLKTMVQPLRDGLAKLLQLNPVSYVWKEGAQKGEDDIGFIAQEVEAIVPEVVHTDEKGMKSVDYPKLVPILVTASQEQQAEIDELKALVSEQENRIEALEHELTGL